MIYEYIKALVGQDLNNLMNLLNDVLMGGGKQVNGGKQERVEKLSTCGNYKCSVQVVYDGVN